MAAFAAPGPDARGAESTRRPMLATVSPASKAPRRTDELDKDRESEGRRKGGSCSSRYALVSREKDADTRWLGLVKAASASRQKSSDMLARASPTRVLIIGCRKRRGTRTEITLPMDFR